MVVLQAVFADRDCLNDSDCTDYPWIEPYPTCSRFICTCNSSSCTHVTSGRYGYEYFCGECGTLGSTCTEDTECPFPSGKCSFGGYCLCSVGAIYGDICQYYKPVTTTKGTIILIVVLVILLLLYKMVASWEAVERSLNRMFCRRPCQQCREEDSGDEAAYGYNPQSENKSAAFTVSSREFLPTSGDPDLAWALELSTQVSIQRRSESLRGSQHQRRRTRRKRRRQRVESETSCSALCPDSFSSDLSSSSRSSSSSQLGALETSSTTFTDLSSSFSSPVVASTGAIPRTRSVPVGKRRRGSEEVIITHILQNSRRSSLSSSDSSSMWTSEKTKSLKHICNSPSHLTAKILDSDYDERMQSKGDAKDRPKMSYLSNENRLRYEQFKNSSETSLSSVLSTSSSFSNFNSSGTSSRRLSNHFNS